MHCWHESVQWSSTPYTFISSRSIISLSFYLFFFCFLFLNNIDNNEDNALCIWQGTLCWFLYIGFRGICMVKSWAKKKSTRFHVAFLDEQSWVPENYEHVQQSGRKIPTFFSSDSKYMCCLFYSIRFGDYHGCCALYKPSWNHCDCTGRFFDY